MADEKPKTIAAKLALITGQMRNVPKKGHNKSQNYDFVRETDVAEKMSALLAEHNLFLHQSVVERSVMDLYKTSSGLTMRLYSVMVQFTWVDGDTGEEKYAATFPGDGADTGDKGVYKAMTGAEKYFLMKTFLVSTGDDPEGDEKVDTTQAAASSGGGPVVVEKADHGTVAKGGKSAKATKAQLDEFKSLAKDLGITKASDLMDLTDKIIASIGGEHPEWADGPAFGAWLKDLPSAGIGKLIVSLKTIADNRKNTSATDVEDIPEDVQDGQPGVRRPVEDDGDNTLELA